MPIALSSEVGRFARKDKAWNPVLTRTDKALYRDYHRYHSVDQHHAIEIDDRSRQRNHRAGGIVGEGLRIVIDDRRVDGPVRRRQFDLGHTDSVADGDHGGRRLTAHRYTDVAVAHLNIELVVAVLQRRAS